MALGGCRRAALFIGIGCFGIVILLVIGFALLVWWANRQSLPQGPPQPQPASLSVPMPATATPPSGSAAADTDPSSPAPVAAGVPLRVTLLLEEGDFTIEPGPPGSDLAAEGSFDPDLYEITTEEGGSVETGRDVTIRFRARQHWLLRFLSHFGEDGPRRDPPRLLVRLPEGQPMALQLKIAKGSSRTELGGLTLTDLSGDFAMGDAALSFARPLAAPLSRLDLRSAMGELGVEGLGHTGAGRIDVNGSMGEMRLDWGGAWGPGTTTHAAIRSSMGEVTLTVPREMRLAPTSSTLVILGGSQAPGARDQEELPADAPVLELDASVSMGNLAVRRR